MWGHEHEREPSRELQEIRDLHTALDNLKSNTHRIHLDVQSLQKELRQAAEEFRRTAKKWAKQAEKEARGDE